MHKGVNTISENQNIPPHLIPTICVEGETPPDFNIEDLVPIKEIVRQHRMRWFVKTSLGWLVLRKLKRLESQEIVIELMSDPKYKEAIDKLNMLKRESGGKLDLMNLNQKQMDTFMEIKEVTEEPNKRYYLPCFELPIFETPEELTALMENLTGEEEGELNFLLSQLANTTVPKEVDTSPLTACEIFNIPISNDLTLENMTAEQSAIFDEYLRGRTEKLNELMSKMRKG